MTFTMKHQIFDSEPEKFEDDNPPDWLLGKEFKWFYEGYILKLKVGESIKSDFQIFTRLS